MEGKKRDPKNSLPELWLPMKFPLGYILRLNMATLLDDPLKTPTAALKTIVD